MEAKVDTIISVSNLEKSFKTNKVLKGVSFDVYKGSIFALLGSNGAGKTTAVRILSTLIRPDGGKATICGYDILRQSNKVRESISLTGQYAAVDEILTGRENLRLIGSLRRLPNPNKKADEMLAAFNLEDAANRRAQTYSGGMRRRLDIAMSLMGDPKVIFLDEPTTGLDPQSRIAMWEMVKGLAGSGTTVFLTTQYLEEAEYLANHIAILHQGVITAEGTADQLKTTLPRGGIKLDFPTKEDADKARSVLEGYRLSTKEDKPKYIDVSTDGSPTQFTDVLTRISTHNIPLTRFTQFQPTLEDVFLTMIGEKDATTQTKGDK